jgi:hypothetical protein
LCWVRVVVVAFVLIVSFVVRFKNQFDSGTFGVPLVA